MSAVVEQVSEPTSHPLDRPIWSALTGPQTQLASGSARAWRIDPAVGLFAAAADPADGAALAGFMADGAPLILFDDAPVLPPHLHVTVVTEPMVQMVADTVASPSPGAALAPLGEADAAEMLALATLTRPGPFLARTHELGGFVGVRAGGRLVAMAGTRLRVPGHVEVSGVCTHPEHRGHGHAARLTLAVATAILAEGELPFLHTFARNTGAIALYERLGFRLCRRLTATMLTPEAPR